MPCNGGYGPSGLTVYVESGKQTSRLCAVFSVLESRGELMKVLNAVDWKEAGVTKASTLLWWEEHQAKDRQRRQVEAASAAREKARRAVLSKLSPSEKKILGIKE